MFGKRSSSGLDQGGPDEAPPPAPVAVEAPSRGIDVGRSPLPSAGLGALLALMAFKAEFTVIALIAVFLLIGLVKKNAILMVDFALDAERAGRAPPDAIYEACLLRFRPIMMTTMAALLGALPLVLRRGDGAELRQPLGIAIVGGLILSQLLTLYTTPVVYLYVDRFNRFWTRSVRGRFRTAL